jgi:hypothetical protein
MKVTQTRKRTLFVTAKSTHHTTTAFQQKMTTKVRIMTVIYQEKKVSVNHSILFKE